MLVQINTVHTFNTQFGIEADESTVLIFRNDYATDKHLTYEQAKEMFGLTFVRNIFAGITAWSVWTSTYPVHCIVKEGFKV